MMIEQEELERELGLGRVDDDEFAFLLSQHFRSAEYPSSRQVDYPDSEHPVISLVYDDKGVIRKIVPGSAGHEIMWPIIRDVQEKLLAPAMAKTSTLILFGQVPTEGYWRYEDKLVIRRAPDEAPRPAVLIGQHPLILEVAYRGAEDGFTDKIRWDRESHKWALILTLLMPGMQIPRRVEFNHTWVVPNHNPPIPGPHTSIEAQEVYLFAGRRQQMEGLSKQGSLPLIEQMQDVPTSIGPGQVLVLPLQIRTWLNSFRSLDKEKEAKILRSAYWLHHSIDVWRLSKSASYQSLIQAVETLIDIPKGQPHCPECRRTLGPGPTRLFSEFLEEYAPSSSGSYPKSARNILYGMRSSLARGNTLLQMDHGTMHAWYGPMPDEHALVIEARQICRRAVITWLERQYE